MTIQDIKQKAQSIITSKLQSGKIVSLDWATHEVINAHGKIKGDGVEFYHICAREFVWEVVKKAVAKYDAKNAEPDEQLILKGHERLQTAYPVEREGERMLVPLDRMTEWEMRAKVKELRKIGQGCLKHADELEEYLEQHINAVEKAG